MWVREVFCCKTRRSRSFFVLRPHVATFDSWLCRKAFLDAYKFRGSRPRAEQDHPGATHLTIAEEIWKAQPGCRSEATHQK